MPPSSQSVNTVQIIIVTATCMFKITEYVLYSGEKNNPNTWRCIINSSNPCLAYRHASDGLAA